MDYLKDNFLKEEIFDAELDPHNTEYIESIDAEVDKGMVDLVKFFNNEVEHQTQYCCSGLIQDHYDIEKLKELDLSKAENTRGFLFIVTPKLLLEPKYHTWDGEKTVIDPEFHNLTVELPEGTHVIITSDGFDTLQWRDGIEIILDDYVLTYDEKTNEVTYKYNIQFGENQYKLQLLFSKLDYNFELYDRVMEQLLEMFMVMYNCPTELFTDRNIRIDVDTEEIVWDLRELLVIPDGLDEDDVVNIQERDDILRYETGEPEPIKCNGWEVALTIDQLKESFCDEEYLDKLAEEQDAYKKPPF